LAIIHHVSVPLGAPCKGLGLYKTEYRAAMRCAEKSDFFEITTGPNVLVDETETV
jgi:choloylglycine hydrolase